MSYSDFGNSTTLLCGWGRNLVSPIMLLLGGSVFKKLTLGLLYLPGRSVEPAAPLCSSPWSLEMLSKGGTTPFSVSQWKPEVFFLFTFPSVAEGAVGSSDPPVGHSAPQVSLKKTPSCLVVVQLQWSFAADFWTFALNGEWPFSDSCGES